jgi:signal transduction histidine kinase
MLDFNDLKELQDTVHPDFTGYGSAAHEFFRTREDLEKMARMQKDQLEGQEFRYDRKPVAQKFFADRASCLILEEFDLFFSGNEHHLLLRLSTLVERIDGAWLVTHVHGSTPDSDIAEEEAFPEQGLQKKNEQLEAKIRERTRELEIEAALERTRAQSMQMQHSSELNEVSNVFHEQLLLLGIDSEFSFVWLPSESRDEHLFWTTWSETVNGEAVFHSRSISYPLDLSDPYNATCIADWESGVSVHEHFVPPKDIVEFFASWEELLEGASHLKAKFFPEGIYYTEAFMKYGCFGIDIKRSLTAEEKSILHRFAIEFERTYSRFLDLQKAEARAWEAQIETALEKVRTHTMGMRSSKDLSHVTSILFEEMKNLGGDLFAFGIVLCDKDQNVVEQWHSLADKGMISPFQVPVDLDYIHQYRYDQWKSGKDLFSIEIPEDYIQVHFDKMYTLPSFKKAMEEVAAKGYDVTTPTWELDYGASFSNGYLLVSSLAPFEESHIFPRFAKVFEQAYTRFLDLQKAEQQAREAEIELALERVRARALAMHQSQELNEVIEVVFDQLVHLGMPVEHAGFILDYKQREDMHIWFASLQIPPSEITIPYFDSAHWNSFREARAQGKNLFTNYLGFEEKNRFYKELFKWIPPIPEEAVEGIFGKPALIISTVLLDTVGLYIENYSEKPFTEEENAILMRFGNVFQQTYTRFLDLQKAEQQAREAQIEASLERVRSQTMAMHQSSDLEKSTRIVFEELEKLELSMERSGIGIFDPETLDCQLYTTVVTESGQKELALGVTSLTIHPMLTATVDAWKSHKSLSYTLEGKDLEDYYKIISKGDFPLSEELIEKSTKLPREYYHYTPITAGGLYFFSDSEPRAGDIQIISRFAEVFDMTYTRYEDLKKAEAQARESQITASLERVRAATMAMHNSGELSDVLSTLFEQFDILGIHPSHAVLTLIDKEKNTLNFRSTGTDGHRVEAEQEVDLKVADAWVDTTEKWKKSSPNSVNVNEYPREVLPEVWEVYSDILAAMPEKSRPRIEDFPDGLFITEGYCRFGYIGFAHNRAPTDEEKDIVRRFATEFGTLYQRFLDLKKAEAQARESQIEAALERVRSRTMAMQHSDELAEASHLLDKEVRELGIKTWGCAFNIYREHDSLEWFGNEAGVLPTYTVPREGIFKEYFNAGQNGESLLIKEIAGEQCAAHYEFMSTLPVVGDVLKQLKKTNGSFPSYQIDHVAYFKYGYLLFITREEVPEAYGIFKRFAKVFEQTYTRFLDLQLKEQQAVKLVEEKQRLEKILSDLQATQKQLIHSEKMASLGELTAGIAHEIQNPLNFVNNFSEVSRELIEELLEELKTGDTEEVDAIAQDVIQNLEKINHHGKRADSIVKGMLQHSRSGDGKKEPTDLNALADEYLRLAYHGLRAKDNAFNASMETDFDPDLAKVKVVPQDIGRVLLNLITNAFHAVGDRKETSSEGYEPTVWVKTRKTKSGVEISVRDNGSGIPDAIRDKIFQPFFTTKPTGEGTGLGLSMSYDIVTKGHGGQLTMESEEGEGTQFLLILPI